jgi:hypothetical protein
VVDIFYVSDRESGAKVTDEARLRTICEAVRGAIAELGQARGER